VVVNRNNCLVFEKFAFLCTDFGDRQTNGQMNNIVLSRAAPYVS